MRHRRRCKGPIQLTNRRKACDACFQAKVKCCYTQPSCTRCTKRGTPCIYATSSEPRSDAVDASPSSCDSTSSQMDFSTLSQQFDLAAWDLSAPPSSLDAFDISMAEYSNQGLDANTFDAAQALMLDENMMFTGSPSGGMPVITSMTKSSSGSAGTPVSMPVFAPTATSASSTAISAASPSPSFGSQFLIRVLSDYPSLLMKGSFSSPILHLSMYALYSNIVPDMTYLPQTSMAICCGSGLKNPDTNRFFRRAIDAAKQRLIGSFVSGSKNVDLT
jgi:hypothetical protein